ncbi:hypothetical protein C0J52_09616 [Blattella germanica]|nr:hypothetical protein C0J52_09616 [Blattella germanica]
MRADCGYFSMETVPPSLYKSQHSFNNHIRPIQSLDLTTSKSYSSSDLENGKLSNIIECAINKNQWTPYGDNAICSLNKQQLQI